MKLKVLNTKGTSAGDIELSDEVFGTRVNTDVIHQAVVKYHASLRQGNASTKERAEVSGGGRKPYRQKGTGRARVGSSRSPLYVGGGVTFGPKKRDFSYSISKKIKQSALRECLKAKIKNQDLICVDDLKEKLEKTKQFAEILKSLNIRERTVMVLDGSDESIVRVSRNITHVKLVRAQDVTAFDLSQHKKVLISKTALNKLVERVS